jgi:hypothetical protein
MSIIDAIYCISESIVRKHWHWLVHWISFLRDIASGNSIASYCFPNCINPDMHPEDILGILYSINNHDAPDCFLRTLCSSVLSLKNKLAPEKSGKFWAICSLKCMHDRYQLRPAPKPCAHI